MLKDCDHVSQIKIGASKPKTRADARRNRERIFVAARACFADESKVYGMEDIARRAGVGVGTLYRAFGNRAGLAEAVFRDMLDVLADAAADLADSSSPWAALQVWLDAYIDQLISKRSIMRELQPLFDQDPHLTEESGRLASEALDIVLARAKSADLVRADVHPNDILQLVNGIVRAGSNDRERIAAMLTIILEGVRGSKVAPSPV